MTLVIGLTGNIGSGKTTAAEVFETLNIPVFYADDESKMLFSDQKVISHLLELFGNQVVNSDHTINRAYLANIVFNDPKKLAELNNLLHPLVYDRFSKWLHTQSSPYVIMEAAILFESGFDKYVDSSICVYANKESRIKRIKNREDLDLANIEARMNNQWDDDKKNTYANYLIDNNDQTLMLPQILSLHEVLLKQKK